MRNGMLEKSDADTLQAIYNKFKTDGMTRTPLTEYEQVLIFCIAKGIKNGKIPTIESERRSRG